MKAADAVRAVSESELPELLFTARDAVLLSDVAQLDFVMSGSNASIASSWLMPVSIEAFDAILARRSERVRSYFDCVDFADCLSWYREKGLQHARTWLHELDLGFEVEGIDVVELDAPCQFLLFTHARYIERTTELLIRANRDIETFYVVTAREPLPLDFYFDSDVAAAVMRFVCERDGRRVRPIIMDRRSPSPCAASRSRRRTDVETPGQSTRPTAQPRGCRVGIAPATIPNQERLFDALCELGCHVTVFPSAWFDDSSGATRTNTDEYLARLSDLDDHETAAVETELAGLWTALNERSSRSTLPAAVIGNPHLGFQLDHVVRRRWRSYANVIRRASRLVAAHPLDLFIMSDHFTPEAAILARLYRRRRTRILVAPHSRWPCDPNWATWESSDAAVMPSRSAAERLQTLSSMREVHVAGGLSDRCYRSLLHPSPSQAAVAAKKRTAGVRKIVVMMANSLEVNSVPFVDLKRHFETVTRLGQVPPALRSRVLLSVRTKHQPHGESPLLYQAVCGFDPEGSAFLDGLTFSEAIDLADCVVSVNLPTTGYFEVMEKGVPLIQVQTAPVATLHPDLPPEVTGRITDPDEMWPAIEAVLFDEERRRRLLRRQQRFITDDLLLDAGRHRDPLPTVLSALLQQGNNRMTFGVSRPFTTGPDSTGASGAVHKGIGYINDILVGPRGYGIVRGWAADLTTCQPARDVEVLFQGECLGTSRPSLFRPDVVAALNDRRLLRSGFRIHVLFAEGCTADTVNVRARLHDGTCVDLLTTMVDRGR